jgi:hypothetical protein
LSIPGRYRFGVFRPIETGRRRRFGRPLSMASMGLALVVATLFSACSTQLDDRFADEQTGGEDADSATVASADACEEEIIEDEYGFPVSIDMCADTEIVVRLSPSDLLASVPTDAARDALSALFRSADGLNAVCGDLVEWAGQGELVAAGAHRVSELLADDQGLVEWLGSDEASSIGALLRNRLVIQSSCEAPATAVVDGAALEAALGAAGRLAGANDALWIALSAADRVDISSEFWFHADQLGHVLEARRLLADGDIDVLMVGPSTGQRGFDPLALSQATGDVYLNASVPSLFPKMVPAWIDTLFEIGVAPTTVVLAVDPWIEFLPCEPAAYEWAVSANEFAARAFATVPGLDEVAPVIRLAGGDSGTNDGPLADHVAVVWEVEGQGRTRGAEERRQDLVDNQLAAYAPRFTDPVRCADRLSTIESTVDSLRGRGL